MYLCGPGKHNCQPFCGPEGRFYCSDSVCSLWPTPFSYLCVSVRILGVCWKLSAAEQVKTDCCHTPAVVSTLLTPLPVSCPLTTPLHYISIGGGSAVECLLTKVKKQELQLQHQSRARWGNDDWTSATITIVPTVLLSNSNRTQAAQPVPIIKKKKKKVSIKWRISKKNNKLPLKCPTFLTQLASFGGYFSQLNVGENTVHKTILKII